MKQFPLTTLIRLYELLKNSRSTCEQSRSQQQNSLHSLERASRFGVDLSGKRKIVAQKSQPIFRAPGAAFGGG
jgi:hypothetical protein